MQRRMKAKIFCLSLALENPHQALDAYMSFATATARKLSCSESSHTNPCLRRTRSAYRVCAQATMTLCTCNVTDRLLVNVTPRILIVCTIQGWPSGVGSNFSNTTLHFCLHLQQRYIIIIIIFTARCYASAVLAMGLCPSVCLCLSVCLSVSVTSRCSTKTAKSRITQTTPHDSPGTQVF